jgi:hypothetical protein
MYCYRVSVWSCFEGSLFGEAGKTVIIYKKNIQYIHRLTNTFIHIALIFVG